MKKIELVKVDNPYKIGDLCPPLEPNLKEDALFMEGGKIVGFYIREISGALKDYIEIANRELRSKNVPKSTMKRSSGFGSKEKEVLQYSTILGGVPPKPHMRRPYPTVSSVHRKSSAKNFIKSMYLACKESEKIIKEIMPEQYEFQKKAITENCPKEFAFSDLFTSSISNYNISAPFHVDRANLKGCLNVIINKKKYANGGDLHIPDYGVTIEASDNSMTVYPAWKSMHGVTPIEPKNEKGYRNSLVFYPLSSFKKYVK